MDSDQLRSHVAQLTSEQREQLRCELQRRQIEKSLQQPIARLTSPDGRYPLTFAQEAIWLGCQIKPAAYNDVRALRIVGILNTDILRRALDMLVEMNPILRVRVGSVDGIPYQRLGEDRALPLTLERMSEGEVNAAVWRLAAQPFNLEHDLLLRAGLYQTGETVHVLAMIIHNLVCDGASLALLHEQLKQNYDALLHDHMPDFTLPQVDYADFSVWQRATLSDEALKGEAAYWKDALEGIPTLLDLPSNVSDSEDSQQTLYQHPLDAAITVKLRSFAANQNVTPFVVLLSAYAALLFRYTEQEQLIVGTTAANRYHPDTAEMIGFFTNLLPLPLSMSAELPFAVLIRQAQAAVLTALEHQIIPFAKITRAMQIEHHADVRPRAQTVITYKDSAPPSFALGDAVATPAFFAKPQSLLPLALEILRDQQGLTCLFRYDPFLFDTAHVQRMAENFEKLLQEALNHPAASIGRLALLSEDEYQQIVYDWNNTALDLSPIQPLHWVFEQQVERTPEHIALIYEEDSRSYRALNALANQWAHHLRKLGIERDVPVALFMGRSIELIVAILGTLKAGGAFVLIDPTYPTDRAVFMLNDTDAPVIITSTVHQSQLPGGLTRHVIVLDAAHETLADYPVTNPTPVNAPDDLVWIPYTSGTTGRPKGVLLTHRGVHNYFFGRSKLYQFSPADTTLTASAVGFDAIFKEIFNPLLNGSKMVILRHGWEGDLGFRQDVSHQHQVTWMRSTPSYWMAFLQHADPQKLSSLRFIELSGEAVTPKLRQQHYDVLPHVMLINAYGPAEACNNVSFENALLPAKRSTIGYPIANTRLYILDLRLNPLPIGVSGMLYLGGTGLARGYLNLPDLTAQRFIMHPVFGRLYQTGDLARRLADGNIEYMGRSDFQVKLRGIRIELAEIESILGAHPNVREAVVLLHEDELGEKRLTAYVTGDAEINSLRELVGEKVPDYMIPSAFVVIAAMPLTRNGKLDRRALPKPEYVNDAAGFVMPRTATEQQIATLFRDLLHTDSIGIHSNFFHLGGHSLLGTRLIMRINQTFGVILSLRALFETPTVGGLARRVEGFIDAPAADDREHIRL